jgi:regulator of sirC expression with transglutaminase-like and TPR domain
MSTGVSDSFADVLELADDHIRLGAACLHLARDEYPGLSVPSYLKRLDELAERVLAHESGRATERRLAALREVLVREEGFKGNRGAYYDPRNSYINDVIDCKRGIPISLAAIWIDVGRRIGWPVCGVGLPGHFLVGYPHRGGMVLIDAFDDGRLVSRDDCKRKLRELYGEGVKLRPEFLKPAPIRGILTRMLTNLHGIYRECGDAVRTERVLRRLAQLCPRSPVVIHELGLIAMRQGRYDEAVSLLRHALAMIEPTDQSRLVLRRQLLHATRALVQRN